MIGTTPRGIYADFLDTYSKPVSVYESSAAEAPHVWVTTADGSAHLSVEQTILLRDALTEFLDTIPTRWPRARSSYRRRRKNED